MPLVGQVAVPREGRADTMVDWAAVVAYIRPDVGGACADATSLSWSIRAGKVVTKGEARC